MKRVPLQRFTPLRRVSKKQRRYDDEFKRRRDYLLAPRSYGPVRCNVDGPTCLGMATEVHHRKLRSQGGTNEFINLIIVCSKCHRYIHEHPAWAYERHLLLRQAESESTFPRCLP